MHDFTETVIGDRYTLERELGRGGMATVWLGRDLRHDRLVAIKILHPELAGAIGVDRFIREVRLTARLQHPNIVPILDSGVLVAPDGTSLPWYAMAYLEGESLRTRLARERQLPIEEALNITEAVGDALQTAHRQGIVHRDIKPENVFLSDGHVYVLDFGIAKALVETGVQRLTSTGLAIGTPAYMSPEQAMADRIDARTDQYSLATILYEMLAGEPPFSGPTAQAIVARRLAEPARPLLPVRSTVPEPVERAVLRALERAPADRFPDLRTFIAALRGTASSGVPRLLRRLGRPRALLSFGLLVVIVTAGWVLASRVRVARAGSTDPGVVALYQRGVRGYDRRTPNGIIEAISAFSAAVARDSAYAPAWTGLAKAYVRAHERAFAYGGLPRDSLLQRAVAAVERALAADSGSADAWLTQALLSRNVDPTDNGPVLRSLRQALALDSTDARTWHFLALALAETGDFTGALAAWRRCVTLDPSYTQGLAFLGLGHYWRRQYDNAMVWADSAIAVDPNYLLARTAAGYVALERGDFARSSAAFDAARRLSTEVEVVNDLAGSALVEARAGRGREARAILRKADSSAAAYVPAPLHSAVYLAQAYGALGDAARAIAWLSRYAPRRDLHFQLHLRCDPPFDPLQSDPRFRSLLVQPAPPPGRGC
jgi:tetratricopeptide (TPR) repeat protein